MEWSKVFKTPSWFVGVSFKVYFKHREGTKCLGVTNRIGRYFTVFLDYDYTNRQLIEAEIRGLQADYLLGDAYFFRTKNGYHVIMLDLLTYNEWIEILQRTSCDEDYKLVSQHNNSRAWVLRLSDKKDNTIKYETTVQGYLGRTLSAPHMKLLLLRGVPEKDLGRIRIYTSERDKELTFAKYEA